MIAGLRGVSCCRLICWCFRGVCLVVLGFVVYLVVWLVWGDLCGDLCFVALLVLILLVLLLVGCFGFDVGRLSLWVCLYLGYVWL